jgi:hypothetical protein
MIDLHAFRNGSNPEFVSGPVNRLLPAVQCDPAVALRALHSIPNEAASLPNGIRQESLLYSSDVAPYGALAGSTVLLPLSVAITHRPVSRRFAAKAITHGEKGTTP